MGSFSNFLEDAFLNHICNVAFTPSSPLYLALCTADPTDAGTAGSMFEVPNTNAYARQVISFNPAANRRVIQTAAVTFPPASGPWGHVTHWAIVSSSVGAGNMYAYGNFTTAFDPVAGNTPSVPINEVQVQMASSQYSAGTISQAAPNILNDSANGFPLWPAGTTIFISGFTGGGFNGQATVVSSTVGQIIVSGPALSNDAAGETVTLALSGGFTDFTVHSWLNRAFRNAVFAKPNTFVGLATALILDSHVAIGQISEVSTSGTGYARVQVNPNAGASPTWALSSGGALDNLQAIPMTNPTVVTSWGLITSCFLIDTASGAGNILAFDNGSVQDQTPNPGDTVQFGLGQFDLVAS